MNDRTLAGLLLLGGGLILLLGFSALWPLFILGPGLGIMWFAYSGGKVTAPFAVPGMLVSGTGGLLLFQTITGYWESWAYAWILYGVFFGVGLMIMGERMQLRELRTIGRTLTVISGGVFLASALIFTIFTSPLFRLMLTIALIATGAYLLWREYNEDKPKIKRTNDAAPIIIEVDHVDKVA